MSKQTEIFKIQQDFTHSLILIYNKNRTTMGQYPIDKTMRKFMGNKLKIYVIGYYDEKTTKVEILRKCTPEELKKINW